MAERISWAQALADMAPRRVEAVVKEEEDDREEASSDEDQVETEE